MNAHWGKLVGYFVATLIVSSAATFGLPLLGGGSWLPDAVAAEAHDVDLLFWGLLALSLVIFSMVAALVIYCIAHFQAAPGDLSDGEHIHGNARLEAVWVVVPAIICIVIAAVSYDVLRKNEVGLFPVKAKSTGADMDVNVRGFSFGWAFRYEGMDPVDAPSELVLPIDKTVRFIVMSCTGREAEGRAREQERRKHRGEKAGHENEYANMEEGLCEKHWRTSTDDEVEAARKAERAVIGAEEAIDHGDKPTEEQQGAYDSRPAFGGDQQYIDVNHGFWVPEARLKVDAQSGLQTYVQWRPTKLSRPDDNYQVVCAELCGSGHNGMRVDMCIVTQDTFDWWVGLASDERRNAVCANLRGLTCIDGGASDPGDAVDAIAKLYKKHPNADCADVEEAVA